MLIKKTTLCFLLILASLSQGFAKTKNLCTEHVKDSVVLCGKVEGYEDAPDRYVMISLLLPYAKGNEAGRSEYEAYWMHTYMDASGSFSVTFPLERATVTSISCHPTWMKGISRHISLTPGDSIYVSFDIVNKCISKFARNGMEEETEFEKLSGVKTDITFADTITPAHLGVALDSVVTRYAGQESFSQEHTDKEKAFLNALCMQLLVYCNRIDEARGVTILDGDTASCLRMAIHRLPIDENSIYDNVDFPFLTNAVVDRAMRHIREETGKDNFETLRDILLPVFSDEKGNVSVWGQYALIRALTASDLHGRSYVDSLKNDIMHVFSNEQMKDWWIQTCDGLWSEPTDRCLFDGLSRMEKINGIRKSHKSQYIDLVFFRPVKESYKRLFMLENLRRDFHKSHSLSFVFCAIVENDSELAELEKFKLRYPEESFIVFTKDEYVDIMNDVSASWPLKVMTIDKKGRVLSEPLDFEDGEFALRYRLRNLLKKQ